MREVVRLSSSSKTSSCRRSPLRHDVISRSFSAHEGFIHLRAGRLLDHERLRKHGQAGLDEL